MKGVSWFSVKETDATQTEFQNQGGKRDNMKTAFTEREGEGKRWEVVEIVAKYLKLDRIFILTVFK